MIATNDYASALDLSADLEAAGFSVHSIETTQRGAIAEAQRAKPDAAVVSSLLRSGIGIEAAERLSEMGVDVLVITGSAAQPQKTARLPRLGYLQKPFSSQQVVGALVSLLRNASRPKNRPLPC